MTRTFPTLYQISSTGKPKQWTISVVDKGTQSEILIESGYVGGKLVKNTSIVSLGKNAGKTNETTHNSQALQEAEAKFKLKIREGYVEDILQIQSQAVLGSGIKTPMLAKKYSRDGSQNSSKTLRQLNLVNKEVALQPKIDGNRSMILVTPTGATMYTRKGDPNPVQLSHILEDVIARYAQLGLTEDVILDAELFTDAMTFNTLNGILKKVDASVEQLEERKKIKLHLYDVMLNEGYKKRYEFIQQFASENIQVIENHYVIATDEIIQEWLENFLARDFEGLMIRQLDQGYENKRTNQLLKVKIFESFETELVGFELDPRSGAVDTYGDVLPDFVGSFIMKLPKPTYDRDGKLVTTFKAGTGGQTVLERAEMWKNQKNYIGKQATIEFFGLSEYKIPRFPKMKGFRDI